MREGEPEARLLVVEDEPNILELLSASLRLAGFEVATATGGLAGMSGPSEVLRRRYRRLLAVYPSDWRAANETVVLDTLLEAAGPTRRWPPPRESLALLVGGVDAWTRRPRPDAGDRGRRWLDGLQLGAILLALWSLAAALGQPMSWVGHGFRDVYGNDPAYDVPAAAADSVVAVLAAATFVVLLRGRVRVALVAVVVQVLAGALWAVVRYPEGTAVDGLAIGPAMVVWLAVVGAAAAAGGPGRAGPARGGAAALVGVAAGAHGDGDRARLGAGGVGGGRDGVAGRIDRRAGPGDGDR